MNGPVVLLVPPAGGDSTTWGRYGEILSGSTRVITYDRRGGPLDEQAAHAAQVIEAAGTGPAIVAGVSAGATIGLRLAVDRPDLVQAMHLHEPPFHGKRHPDPATIRTVIATQRREKKGKTVEAAEEFARWAYRRSDGTSIYEQWPEAWRRVVRGNAESVLADIRIATGESIRRRDLTAVTVPVLCTAGSLSRKPMRRLVERLAAALPQGDYREVSEASHGAIFEQPESMASMTLGLCRATTMTS